MGFDFLLPTSLSEHSIDMRGVGKFCREAVSELQVSAGRRWIGMEGVGEEGGRIEKEQGEL